MTKKAFKSAMLRGLGRCVIAVRQEPEKYRDLVFWACQRNIAYDAQCEGSRSWYVYTMASVYPNKEPFIAAAADALRKCPLHRGWDLLYLSELLIFFSEDVGRPARKAVVDKYREVLAKMFARKRRAYPVFHELAALEQLGLVLSTSPGPFLRACSDFGKLYGQKPFLEDGDFEWFFNTKGKIFRADMKRAAKKDGDIARFLQREQAFADEWAAKTERWKQQRETVSPETLTGYALSRWLAKKADPETMEHYAEIYRKQAEPELRAAALEAFSTCRYPGNPEPIIEDADSPCENLQNAAWRALENIRHPAVRDFALASGNRESRASEIFSLLVTNYQPKDAPILEAYLNRWINEKDWDSFHAAGHDIHRAFDPGSGIPHPKHLLPILYTYNPCSFCREYTLHHLAKHKMLTQEILTECLYDSNEDIRRYAEKQMMKKEKPK